MCRYFCLTYIERSIIKYAIFSCFIVLLSSNERRLQRRAVEEGIDGDISTPSFAEASTESFNEDDYPIITTSVPDINDKSNDKYDRSDDAKPEGGRYLSDGPNVEPLMDRSAIPKDASKERPNKGSTAYNLMKNDFITQTASSPPPPAEALRDTSESPPPPVGAGIEVLGLRVEEHAKEVVLTGGIGSLQANTDAVLRLFGKGFAEDTEVLFTAEAADRGDKCTVKTSAAFQVNSFI